MSVQKAFDHVSSAARTANRVVAVIKGEADNTTDAEFKGKLASSSDAIVACEQNFTMHEAVPIDDLLKDPLPCGDCYIYTPFFFSHWPHGSQRQSSRR